MNTFELHANIDFSQCRYQILESFKFDPTKIDHQYDIDKNRMDITLGDNVKREELKLDSLYPFLNQSIFSIPLLLLNGTVLGVIPKECGNRAIIHIDNKGIHAQKKLELFSETNEEAVTQSTLSVSVTVSRDTEIHVSCVMIPICDKFETKQG